MASQQRPSAGPSGKHGQQLQQQPALERNVFSPQLWKAVGLLPRQLNIARAHFFPDELASTRSCPSVPSSSKGSDDGRQRGAHRNAQTQQQLQQESHKRRRSSAMRSPQRQPAQLQQQPFNGLDAVPSSFFRGTASAAWAPDVNAMMRAPRRPRTLATRRRLRNLHRLAAEFPFPSSEEFVLPAASPATSMHQQPSMAPAAHRHASPGCTPQVGQPWTFPPQQPASQQPFLSGCQLATQQTDSSGTQHKPALGSSRKVPQAVAVLQPDNDLLGTCLQPCGDAEKRQSTKGSPASHSAESSLGVFADLHGEGDVRADADGDLASPGMQATQHHQAAAWCRSSPLSSDDAY